MPHTIDLRSDTVTRPTPGMLEAMFNAKVGDDVFGEDPTVKALEEKAADLLGKDTALFVPSGTMANQIAIRLLTRPGDEVLIEAGAHPFVFECGAASVISSVLMRPLPGQRGLLTPEQVEAEIRPTDNIHFAPTRLVCVENTHNFGGGTVYPLETVAEIRAVVERHNLVMHMDGARLFNACQAAGVAPSTYAKYAETVSFCLSKGLGAPVGSMLVGKAEIMIEARRWRKAMGGGMRQAGFLAAAGIYALDHHIQRLGEDHENARILARGLANIDGLSIDPEEMDTNIVIFNVVRPGLTAAEFAGRLDEEGVRVIPIGPSQIRAVTHLDVNREEILRALDVAAKVMKN